jgi:hypothetical protein
MTDEIKSGAHKHRSFICNTLPWRKGRERLYYNGTFTNNNPPLLPNKAGLSDDKAGLFLYNH